jgi:hypothetical protein
MGVLNYTQSGRAADVIKSDINLIPSVSGGSPGEGCILYIGGTGNVRVLTIGGDDVVFHSVPVGTTLQVKVRKVFSTGTTATNIMALW